MQSKQIYDRNPNKFPRLRDNEMPKLVRQLKRIRNKTPPINTNEDKEINKPARVILYKSSYNAMLLIGKYVKIFDRLGLKESNHDILNLVDDTTEGSLPTISRDMLDNLPALYISVAEFLEHKKELIIINNTSIPQTPIESFHSLDVYHQNAKEKRSLFPPPLVDQDKVFPKDPLLLTNEMYNSLPLHYKRIALQGECYGKVKNISIPPTRHVSQELVNSLDPLERSFADKYIREGRWILDSLSKIVN